MHSYDDESGRLYKLKVVTHLLANITWPDIDLLIHI